MHTFFSQLFPHALYNYINNALFFVCFVGVGVCCCLIIIIIQQPSKDKLLGFD